jgi:hypothetical protein
LDKRLYHKAFSGVSRQSAFLICDLFLGFSKQSQGKDCALKTYETGTYQYKIITMRSDATFYTTPVPGN